MKKVKVWGGFGEKNSNKNTQWQLQNRIYDSEGLCPALTTWCTFWVLVREKKERDDDIQ